jgi:hypothetical protein
MLHGCSNGFSAGSKDEHGGSCNDGDPCAGGEGGVPIGGSAGADSGGGSSGRGGSGEQGGVESSSGSGGDQGGIAGDGGADTGGSGNAATGGRAGSGGGSGGGSSGGTNGGQAGNGGSAGGEDGECSRPLAGIPVTNEEFDSDVFAAMWTRSDTSVSVSGGLLRIGPDGSDDDYAEFPLNSTALPVFFEARARVVSGNAVFPLTTLFYTGFAAIYLASGSDPASWQFSGDGFQTGSQLPNWDASVGDWITARAFINVGGGMLCAKRESDANFTKIVTSGWSSTATSLQRLRLRQHFDEVVEIDNVILTRL